MERDEIVRSLEKLIRLPAEALNGSEKLNALDGWDSLAMIEFIALMDEDFGVDLQAEQVRTCKTVQDLVDLAVARV